MRPAAPPRPRAPPPPPPPGRPRKPPPGGAPAGAPPPPPPGPPPGNHRRHHRDGYRRQGRHGRDVRCPDARIMLGIAPGLGRGACCPVPDAARHRDAGTTGTRTGRTGPAPGRGAGGRGAGAGTDEYGLLPTRGVRGPGLGPPGRAAGATGAAGTAGRAGAAGAAGAAGGRRRGDRCRSCRLRCAGAQGRCRRPAAAAAEAARAAGAGDFPAGAFLGSPAGAESSALGNDSRSRPGHGASTVDDADLTNSPCSFRRSSTILLVTPSSLASSCTRALPATALLHSGGRAAPAATSVNSDTCSSWNFTVRAIIVLPVLPLGPRHPL